MIRSRWFRRLLTLVAGALCAFAWQTNDAGEVQLKNGVTVRGNPTKLETLIVGPKRPDPLPTKTYPIVMVANPLQRTYVPERQVAQVNKDIDLSKNEVFRLKQPKMAGGTRVIQSVGDFLEKPPAFDEFGRRLVRLRANPANLEPIQGVTEITPEYLKIVACNYAWETGLATSSVPFDVLDPILRKANGSNDLNHQMRIARFYIQAGMYGPAERALESIANQYAAQAETVTTVRQVQVLLMQSMALELANDLKLRRSAGQHRLVEAASRSFPVENVSTSVLREVRDMAAEYESTHNRILQIQALLAELQAQLGDDPRVAELAPRRAEISEKLADANVDRLDAFWKLSADSKLKADEKLALALSGWVVGSENAVTELDQALRFWQARFLILDYLRTAHDAETERRDIRGRIEALEGLGAPRVAQILPLLPPPLDPAGAAAGKVARIQVASPQDEPAVAYRVLLPPEYHPDHRYPLMIALHGEKRTPEQELAFWGGTEARAGQSQRHGYIVIAPEYASRAGQTEYDYSPVSHDIVLASLRDARRRFHVDSDRVFLSGHEMGGDAAFDIGLSHPDLFAGVIPITGVSDRYCEFYWENARRLPLYVVSGELDRDTVAKNAKELQRMMLYGFDLIYTEYVGAGPDSFYSEIHKLFDWMSRHRRTPLPKQFEVKTLRPTDNRFYWYEFDGLPKGVLNVTWGPDKRRSVHPMSVSATINDGNTIVLQSGAEHHRIWLTPEGSLINFEKRIGVRIRGTHRFNDFVKPDLGVMIESFRYHADRERIFWALLEF
jgi:poly(3-hydroxybutyrate) depolymerase